MSQHRVVPFGGLIAVVAGGGAFAVGAPVPLERATAEKELAALGVKLHGAWLGGPCEGRLTFRADGTYEWSQRGPAGLKDTGTWGLRGDAQKPVLVLKCKTSDDPDREGATTEVKLEQLDQNGFSFCVTESSARLRFCRGMKEPRAP